jgi:MFS family permease
MIGFTQEYLTPFLLSISATVRQIGILNALPNLVGSLVQLRSAEVTERLGSRRRVINIFVLLQSLMLIPMALISFTGRSYAYAFIWIVTLFTAFGAFAAPAWGSLMSDLVPCDRRGEYFGFRTMLVGLTTIVAMFIAGFIIHSAESVSLPLGFTFVFFLACVFRLLSWSYLNKMHDPPLRNCTDREFTFLKFIASIRGDNFARFVVSISLMNFSVNLAGPYFAVLMLRELKFSYLLYTIIMVTASMTVFLTIRRWGMHADKVGNIKVIKSTSRLISVIPLFWIISQDPLILMIAQVFSGFIWAGFNLSAANFIYDAVPPENRTKSIAYFNVINGLSLSAGALLGGFLIKILPPLYGSRILSLLLISSIMRFLVNLIMIPRLREVRPVTKVRSLDLFFSIIGLRPLLGIERKTLRY